MGKCNFDITIEQGANFYWVIYIADEIDGVETPRDLTDYDVVMPIRYTKNGDVLDEYSIDNGEITLVEAEGKIIINAEDSATELYPDDFDGVYEVKLTAPITGFVERIVQGNAVVSAEVPEE